MHVFKNMDSISQSFILHFPQHEEEPPQNMKPQAGNDKPLSKTALKNQRKHEAKKAAKQVFGTLIFSKQNKQNQLN